VLTYEGGSPCGTEEDKDKRGSASVHEGAAYKYHEYDDEEDDEEDDKEDEKKKEKEDKDKSKDKDKVPVRRKSATFSFLCDRDADTPTAASFVGSDPDQCAYFFEVRSQHACAGAEPHKPGSVGPGGVFAIIFFITVLVYIIGGVFYQRTVAHARGWRQLPNYSMWAGIWSFIRVRPLSLLHQLSLVLILRPLDAVLRSLRRLWGWLEERAAALRKSTPS